MAWHWQEPNAESRQSSAPDRPAADTAADPAEVGGGPPSVAERIFKALAEHGKVTMPFQKTF